MPPAPEPSPSGRLSVHQARPRTCLVIVPDAIPSALARWEDDGGARRIAPGTRAAIEPLGGRR
jgi:hypothetical protein